MMVPGLLLAVAIVWHDAGRSHPFLPTPPLFVRWGVPIVCPAVSV